MVNKSKKIEVNDIRKPDIINGLDFSCITLLFEEEKFSSFLLEIKLEKGLITI